MDRLAASAAVPAASVQQVALVCERESLHSLNHHAEQNLQQQAMVS